MAGGTSTGDEVSGLRGEVGEERKEETDLANPGWAGDRVSSRVRGLSSLRAGDFSLWMKNWNYYRAS